MDNRELGRYFDDLLIRLAGAEDLLGIPDDERVCRVVLETTDKKEERPTPLPDEGLEVFEARHFQMLWIDDVHDGVPLRAFLERLSDGTHFEIVIREDDDYELLRVEEDEFDIRKRWALLFAEYVNDRYTFMGVKTDFGKDKRDYYALRSFAKDPDFTKYTRVGVLRGVPRPQER